MSIYWVNKDSAAEKYKTDAHFRVLVDTFSAMYEGGQFTPSELREAAIYAALRVECRRIRPLIFDPNNYTIEQGVLAASKGWSPNNGQDGRRPRPYEPRS